MSLPSSFATGSSSCSYSLSLSSSSWCLLSIKWPLQLSGNLLDSSSASSSAFTSCRNSSPKQRSLAAVCCLLCLLQSCGLSCSSVHFLQSVCPEFTMPKGQALQTLQVRFLGRAIFKTNPSQPKLEGIVVLEHRCMTRRDVTWKVTQAQHTHVCCYAPSTNHSS